MNLCKCNRSHLCCALMQNQERRMGLRTPQMKLACPFCLSILDAKNESRLSNRESPEKSNWSHHGSAVHGVGRYPHMWSCLATTGATQQPSRPAQVSIISARAVHGRNLCCCTPVYPGSGPTVHLPARPCGNKVCIHGFHRAGAAAVALGHWLDVVPSTLEKSWGRVY